jgi:hypothetical protein
MTLREAADATPSLKLKWQPGLQALRPEDKTHIRAADTRAITGSVDIDTALAKVQPNANRWDFGIGFQHEDRRSECMYFVELHTANDSQVYVVIRKLRWLLAWLKGEGKAFNGFERDFVWVSSGRTDYTLNGPQRRAFADLALRQTGGVFRIPRKRGSGRMESSQRG